MNPAIFVAIGMAAARQRVICGFRDAGATSADAAQPVEQLDRMSRRHMDRFVECGVVRQPTPGRYYLDEARLQEWQSESRRRGLLLVGALLLIVIVVVALTR